MQEETQHDFARDAEKARSNPVYVCFEEPSSPLIWPAHDPDDPGWGGKAKVGGYPETTCTDHPELGCGWFRLEREARP